MKPLPERIAALRAEIDALLDERAEEVAKTCPGVPVGVVRQSIVARYSSDCQCRQVRALDDAI